MTKDIHWQTNGAALFGHPILSRADIQSDLVALLDAPRKRDAEKIAAQMLLQQVSLAALIANAPSLGFASRRKHFDHIPEERKLTMADRDAFFDSDNPAAHAKSFQKISALFDARKMVNAHLFELDRRWHIFYFSPADFQGEHGRMGPHVHYISDLFLPEQVCGLVWQELDNRVYRISGAHIRIDYKATRRTHI